MDSLFFPIQIGLWPDSPSIPIPHPIVFIPDQKPQRRSEMFQTVISGSLFSGEKGNKTEKVD